MEGQDSFEFQFREVKSCTNIDALKTKIDMFEDAFWKLSDYFDTLGEYNDDVDEEESMKRLKKC